MPDWTSYGPGNLNLWPFYHLAFTCDLDQPTRTNNSNRTTSSRRATVPNYWNPCINVEVMVRTCSIYDHFIIWPSSVTLTFNLPKQMFQMALVLVKENNCTKFWNPCMNVQVMATTNPDRRTYIQCTYTEVVTTMSRSQQVGSTKIRKFCKTRIMQRLWQGSVHPYGTS